MGEDQAKGGGFQELMNGARLLGNLVGPAIYSRNLLRGLILQSRNPAFHGGRVAWTSKFRLCMLKDEPIEPVVASVRQCIDLASRRLTADFGSWMRVPFVHIVYASKETYLKIASWRSRRRAPVEIPGGVFHAREATVYIGMDGPSVVHEAILVHELVHAAISRWMRPRRGKCVWASEGYAYYVAHEMATSRGAILDRFLQCEHFVGIPSGDAFRNMLSFENARALSLSLQVAPELFVRFLLDQRGEVGRAVKQILLSALLGYWKTEFCVARCEKAFGRDIGRIEAEFRDFCLARFVEARDAREPRRRVQRLAQFKGNAN